MSSTLAGWVSRQVTDLAAELELARRVAVTLEQQVALLSRYVQAVAEWHDDHTGQCYICDDDWPCQWRVEADRVLLAVSAVEPADPS